MAGTPKASLKSLGPKKRISTLNFTLAHLSVFFFISLVFFIWAILYTFQPSGLLHSDDFIVEIGKPASVDSDADQKSHKVFSDKGRLAIFLYSLLIAFVSTVVFFFLMKYKKHY